MHWVTACALGLGCMQALGEEPAAPSFDIQVQASDEVRGLLERHLQLQRYRAVSDLDARELEQLQVLATRDARELLGTLGYFSPQIEIAQAPVAAGQRPVIVLKITPGPATQIAQVQLNFEGELADATDRLLGWAQAFEELGPAR